MVDVDSEVGHAAVAVGRVADGEDGSCHDPLLNTGREDSWKDSLRHKKLYLDEGQRKMF